VDDFSFDFSDLGRAQHAKAVEDIIDPDIAHDGEKIRQGRNTLGIINPLGLGPIGIGRPIIAVGQQHLPGSLRVLRFSLFFKKRGGNDGHFEQPAGRPVPKDILRVEALLPLGDKIILMVERPVGGSAGEFQILCEGDGCRPGRGSAAILAPAGNRSGGLKAPSRLTVQGMSYPLNLRSSGVSAPGTCWRPAGCLLKDLLQDTDEVKSIINLGQGDLLALGDLGETGVFVALLVTMT